MRVIAAVQAVFTGLSPLAEDDPVAALCCCKTFAWLAEVRAEVVIVGLHRRLPSRTWLASTGSACCRTTCR